MSDDKIPFLESDDKPVTMTTMLLSFYHPGQPVLTVIMDIASVHVEYNQGHELVTLMNPVIPEAITAPCCEIIIAYCDDPTMLHAGDWGDLGTTRILIHMKDAVLQKEQPKDRMQWRCNVKETNIIIPERWPPFDTSTTEFFI